MDKLLNIRVIKDIQKQISTIKCVEGKDYKSELLMSYLSGVESALFETGLTFKLRVINENYHSNYYVCVEQYADYADCWSPKTVCGEIYENEVICFKEQ